MPLMHYTIESLDWTSYGPTEWAAVRLTEADTAVDPSSTSRVFRGTEYRTVQYVRYQDGGITATPERRPDPERTWVVCVRDPDADNDYTIFEGTKPGVEIVDLDFGRADLRDKDEAEGYAESWKTEVEDLPSDHPARLHVEGIADSMLANARD